MANEIVRRRQPYGCPIIAAELLKNSRAIETKNMPPHDYLEHTLTYFNTQAREDLIDWLLDSYVDLKLIKDPEILHLAVNYIDRYLSGDIIMDDNHYLELVGTTCLFIAAKFHEYDAPELIQYIEMSGKKFLAEKIVEMERFILRDLNYAISTPTSWRFLGLFLYNIKGGYELEVTAKLIVNMSFFSYDILRFLPSQVAASAIFLAKYVLGHSEKQFFWDLALENCTLYKASDLRDCVDVLYGVHCERGTLRNDLPPVPAYYFNDVYKVIEKFSKGPLSILGLSTETIILILLGDVQFVMFR